jgi:hypothetical protein
MKALHDLKEPTKNIARSLRIQLNKVYEMINQHFLYEERSLYIAVLDSDKETELVIEAEENQDFKVAYLAKNKRINKKNVSADTV